MTATVAAAAVNQGLALNTKSWPRNEHSVSRIGMDQTQIQQKKQVYVSEPSAKKHRFEFPSTGADRKVWISLQILCRQTVPLARPFQAPVIHNEWAQPNSFPWCEIGLSACDDGSLKTKGPLCIFNQAPSLPEREEISLSPWPSQFRHWAATTSCHGTSAHIRWYCCPVKIWIHKS